MTYLKSTALSAEGFLAENEFLGGHHNIKSLMGGFYSFIHDIERLNLSINTFNDSLSADTKLIAKKCNSGSPNMTNISGVGFLNKVIVKYNDFLSHV